MCTKSSIATNLLRWGLDRRAENSVVNLAGAERDPLPALVSIASGYFQIRIEFRITTAQRGGDRMICTVRRVKASLQ